MERAILTVMGAKLPLAIFITTAVSLFSQASVSPDGIEACQGCHSSIYNSYRTTGMANASGPAADGLIAGEFAHKKSGVLYRVYPQDGRVWMSYERPGDPIFMAAMNSPISSDRAEKAVAISSPSPASGLKVRFGTRSKTIGI